jgi:hypothetical protein
MYSAIYHADLSFVSRLNVAFSTHIQSLSWNAGVSRDEIHTDCR